MMKLIFNKYGTYYFVTITYSDGDIISFRSKDIDRLLTCFTLLGFDDTYTITHEFMKKYEQYKKGETV